jgi:cytochrome P450
MTDAEIIGSLQLLILGGLHTTTGALGMMVHRFCLQPEIPERLRANPELIPTAVEELLRLDSPMVAIARTATRDTELDGQQIAAGDKLMIYWGSANRDGAVFDHPDEFDLDRSANRHVAFGVGPHRCAGSNVARLNLRVAVEEIVMRLHDLRLATDDEIEYHATVNRGPVSLPITFTPGRRHQPS